MTAVNSTTHLQAAPPAKFQQQLAAVLNASPYLRGQLAAHPEWEAILHSPPYTAGQLKQHVQNVLRAVNTEDELLHHVRQIRHQHTVRIAWRDLAGLSALAETMHDTSALADALITGVLDWWYPQLCLKYGTPYNRTGAPQQLLILGLGKLGGNELNFSSDIDLIFTFPEAGETDGRRALDNQTFFTRLGQKVINSLAQVTAAGFAYRVDMRLRPFGDAGALALSFDAMEHYYQTHGREWERYALIKARLITDGNAAGAELQQRLQPFIYRRYLDYGAVAQLRELKHKINHEAQRSGKQQDIKLGSGGIREIEFTVQVFQLMRGGRLSALQHTNLLATLQVLEQLQLLRADDYQPLQAAYCFLRRTENRLQMWNDEQVHALPQDPLQRQQLALSMQTPDWANFKAQLDQHRAQVSAVFQRIFAVDDAADKTQQALSALWPPPSDTEQALDLLTDQGFTPADAALHQLTQLRDSRRYQSLTELACARLDRFIPTLIRICAMQTHPLLALERSLQVVQAIASRSGYIAMLGDQVSAAEQFVKLVHASSWISSQLTQHPILLDSLLDTRQLYQPLNRSELHAALVQDMRNIDPNDTESVMARLRQFKLAQTLRVAAADISGVLPLMVVSDQLSWIAEVILTYTTQHVWRALSAQNGVPSYQIAGQPYEADFGIVAYGKLGGLELGYDSDLDIIFIHNSSGQQQRTNGPRPLDNSVFFVRLAQKIIHILSTYTHDGRLYEIDTRLRPSGQSGLLVSSIDALQQYQLEKAWTWEHQALLRARMITGTAALQQRYAAVRQRVLCQPRQQKTLREEVVAMREKMWRTQAQNETDPPVFNLKKDQGGITDLEFIVQYLILAHAHQYPELIRWSDNIRQLASLQQKHLLSEPQADELATTYRTLRNQIHALALQEQAAVVPHAQFQKECDRIRQYWAELIS